MSATITHRPPVETASEDREAATRSQSANLGKRRILLQIAAEPGAEVFVVGDFNDWKLAKHRLTDKGHPGHYRRFIFVEPGRYEYKFNIDGEWRIDPNCSTWAPNKFGSLNSVIETR